MDSWLRRSRKGAWIEMNYRPNTRGVEVIAPVRERGLKSLCYALKVFSKGGSLP